MENGRFTYMNGGFFMVNSVDMSIDFSYAWKTPTNTLFESGILLYLHLIMFFVDFFMIHAGKDSNPMDGMGHKHRKLHGKNRGAKD